MPDFIAIPEGYGPPFHKLLGVRMGIGPNKEGVAWVEIDPEKHYGNRWAHGGMVGALADIASGIAIGRMLENPMNAIDGTIELKVNFLRKVVEGDLTATARVLHFGKRVAVTEVDLTNKDRLCAKAIATFMLRRDLDKPQTAS
ncbi:MAG: PaaI family thioesterase [Actinobacteria bacterium]|nr:MAG: PaaI family thioesterase [Actinomycetota bacterium]